MLRKISLPQVQQEEICLQRAKWTNRCGSGVGEVSSCVFGFVYFQTETCNFLLTPPYAQLVGGLLHDHVHVVVSCSWFQQRGRTEKGE